MGTAKQRGFTIIEVTLFLAISGLLAVLLMTGWVTRVNSERYRDSVVTLQSFLQQQYNLVYNVENERSSELKCDSSADVTPGLEPKGQSDCVLLGRFISVKTDSEGTILTVQPIIGYEGSPVTSPISLERLLHENYKVQAQDINMGLSDIRLAVPWGAVIDDSTKPDGTSKSFAKDFSIAIIRSPLDGTAHTYVAKDTTDMQKVLGIGETGPGSDVKTEDKDIKMCLDPGAPFSGGAMAVIIRAYASSQNAVTTSTGVGC